jgi:hypothetical protein
MRRKIRRDSIDKLKGRLTAAQPETIRGDNPFRRERNKLIRNLWLRGVKGPLIAGISALSKSTVYRIGAGEDGKYKKRVQKRGLKGNPNEEKTHHGAGTSEAGGFDPGTCASVRTDRVEVLSGDVKKGEIKTGIEELEIGADLQRRKIER